MKGILVIAVLVLPSFSFIYSEALHSISTVNKNLPNVTLPEVNPIISNLSL